MKAEPRVRFSDHLNGIIQAKAKKSASSVSGTDIAFSLAVRENVKSIVGVYIRGRKTTCGNGAAGGGKMDYISRIILVDDNPISGRVYADLLAEATDVDSIQRYCDVASVEHNCGCDDRCLVVVNFDLIPVGGFSALETLRDTWPNATLVIVSGAPDSELARVALDAGVVAYLPRTFSGKAVIAVLRLVLEGESFMPTFPSPGRRGEAALEAPAPVAEAESASDLTLRQREILRMIAEGAPNKTIARSLGISHVTVKSHLSRIYRTLGVSSRTQAARRCLLNGDGRHVLESPFFPPPHAIPQTALRS